MKYLGIVMDILIKLRIVLFFWGIVISGYSSIYSQASDIANKQVSGVVFGDVIIHLPEIAGFIQSYDEPEVMEIMDRINYPGNTILAFYIPSTTYKKIIDFDDYELDNYFQIYAFNKLKGVYAGQTELQLMADNMASGYMKSQWYDLKEKFDKNYGDLDFEVGRPVLLDSYSPHKNVRSNVMLMKLIDELYDKEYIQVMIINHVLIKNRLIWFAYYKNYEDEASIKQAKSNNDYGVLLFLEDNS